MKVRTSVAGQPPGRARFILELGVEQLGHQVVRGVLDPPVDVLAEELSGGEAAVAVLHRLAVLGAQVRIGPLADRILVLLRNAQQHADHAHGHLRTHVGDEVESPGTDERVQAAAAELANLRLEGVHPPGREDPGHQAAADGVDGRILEDEPARRDLDVGLDQLDDGPAPRDVGVVVEQTALDVVEAAERVEVVLLVVVERRLLAQAPEHRIRVRGDLDRVGVVVDRTLAVDVSVRHS